MAVATIVTWTTRTVFGFAKQSGGDVNVRSEVGVGTCFTIYLRSSAKRPGCDWRVANIG